MRGQSYNNTMKRILHPIVYEEDRNVHSCQGLYDENVRRTANMEVPVHIFKDFEVEQWNMAVGLEFIRIAFCPECGEKL